MKKRFLVIKVDSDYDFYVGKYAHFLTEILEGDNVEERVRLELDKMYKELYPTEKLKVEGYKMHPNLIQILGRAQNYKDKIFEELDAYGEYYLGVGNQEFEMYISEYDVKEVDGRFEICLNDHD